MRGERAHDSEAHWYAAYGKCGACAPTVRVLTWGRSVLRAAARRSKSYRHMARTPALQQAMSNAWLKAQGLVGVKDLWCKAQGYTT